MSYLLSEEQMAKMVKKKVLELQQNLEALDERRMSKDELERTYDMVSDLNEWTEWLFEMM